jgi:hypothetical protein
MARTRRTDDCAQGVLTTLHFAYPKKRPDYAQGFVVLFAVQPKVGDIIEIDQNSIRKLEHEDMHCCTWKVVDVRHALGLEPDREESLPMSSIEVTAHPHEAGRSKLRVGAL